MKEQKVDMTLSSASLTKISELINRGSKVYIEDVDVNENRKEKRENYLKKLVKEEMRKIV